jgi:hypothetical protein
MDRILKNYVDRKIKEHEKIKDGLSIRQLNYRSNSTNDNTSTSFDYEIMMEKQFIKELKYIKNKLEA